MKNLKIAFAAAALTLATPALAADAVINSVSEASNVVTIRGANFLQPRGRFDIYVSGFTTPLTASTYTNDTIVAFLPAGIAPGSYAAALVPPRGVSASGDDFSFTLGAQGAKGDKGDTGDTGPQGTTGQAGLKGDKGDKGDTGAQGSKGDTGAQGPQGVQGVKGDTGAQGTQGNQGLQGVPGTTGMQAVTSRYFGGTRQSNGSFIEILRVTVDVTRLPADIVATFSSGVFDSSGQPVCYVNYQLFLPTDAMGLQDRLTVAAVTNFTLSAPANRTGSQDVYVTANGGCNTVFERGALTVMVLPH